MSECWYTSSKTQDTDPIILEWDNKIYLSI